MNTLGLFLILLHRNAKELEATDSLHEELVPWRTLSIKSANRLATIGKASASLAHESKTPLMMSFDTTTES